MEGWKGKLKRGILENEEILIELTLGGECGEWLPSLALYDKEKDLWYYFDNEIRTGFTEDEAFRNAVEFFEKLIIGLEVPILKVSPLKEAPKEVYEKLESLLEELRNEDQG